MSLNREALIDQAADSYDRTLHAALVLALRSEGAKPVDYDQLGERTRRLRRRQTRGQMVAAFDALVPLLAEAITGMCDWVANDYGARSQQPLHEEFHFGFHCPYEAVAAILRGEPDPRHTLRAENDHAK